MMMAKHGLRHCLFSQKKPPNRAKDPEAAAHPVRKELPKQVFLDHCSLITVPMSLLSRYPFKGRQELAAASDRPAITVTAGAGSGKTLTLTGRYLYLLEQGHPLRSLIAITFTEKAAREMRTRIRSALDSEQGKIKGEIDAARIGTIHSLCAEVLRAHPAEAGLDPAFTVLEEGLSAALRAEAIETALAWTAGDPEVAALFASFKENELRRLLADLLGRRLDLQDWLEGTTEDGRPPTDAWRSALDSWLNDQFAAPTWQEALAELAALASPNPEDKLEAARRSVLARWDETRAHLAAQNWDAAFLCLAALRKATTSTGGSKTNWDAVALEAARDAMRAINAHYDENLKTFVAKSRWALDEQAASLLPALRRLVRQAFQEYKARKDERQALDFDDLEGRAADLLAANPSVRARWQSEIHAVLVDEFQDTNDRQRQIVYALAGFNPHAAPLSEEKGARGIFVVGDQKQSIYKFRGADVTIFRQVQEDILRAGGLAVDLDLTFRTHKPLLDLLNPLLAPILGEQDDPARPYQVPFAPLQAHRLEPKIARPPYVEFHVGLGEDAAEARSTAANALADRLCQIHERDGFAWGQMALLFRSSAAFETYENALERAGIPFVTVAGRGFYNRPEIRDLMNAMVAIADPTDDLALAGLLRSPAFALPDDDLYRLRFSPPSSPPLQGGEEGGRGVLRGVWPALRASAVPLHRRAADIIEESHELSGRAPAAEVLKRLLDRTAYRALLQTVPGGSRMARNVDKLLSDAHRSGLVGLGEFIEYVQTLRDVGLREGEAPVDPSTRSGGAVQLMTVHKSKGLEFPLVVIADAAAEPMGRASGALFDPALGLLPALQDADERRPATWQLAALNEASKDDAESRRLLYVAATRAQEKLLVSGHARLLKGGKLSLRGWLGDLGQVMGMEEMAIPDGSIERLEWSAALTPGGDPIPWVAHPPAAVAGFVAPGPEPAPISESTPGDLVAPLVTPAPETTDDRTRARETDPPDRVWRVVPKAKRPTGPAWVVGKLVHEALRRWRWPVEDGFLRAYALEAGLADEVEIRATVQAAQRLLGRFQASALFAEIDASEHYHELPYLQAGGRGVIDLLYRAGGQWVIVDFKTDEVRSPAEALDVIAREGYGAQLRRYVDAAAPWLGTPPQARLAFLQVGGAVQVFEEQSWT
jgi:ATP-dependent helicase/nuclease subunit A